MGYGHRPGPRSASFSGSCCAVLSFWRAEPGLSVGRYAVAGLPEAHSGRPPGHGGWTSRFLRPPARDRACTPLDSTLEQPVYQDGARVSAAH